MEKGDVLWAVAGLNLLSDRNPDQDAVAAELFCTGDRMNQDRVFIGNLGHDGSANQFGGGFYGESDYRDADAEGKGGRGGQDGDLIPYAHAALPDLGRVWQV